METPKEYYYTYYSYEEWGRGYIGSRRCKCLPEEDIKYFGSFSDKTFKPTHKIILKDDYATREEAYADEIILQQYFKVVENKHFANRAYQTSTKFCLSKEQAIENGKKVGAKYGKIIGAENKKLKRGIFGLSPEERSENSKKAAKLGHIRTKELGVGIYALTTEQRRENGRKSLTLEQRRENGRKGGKISGKKVYEQGLGIHSLTPEQRSEIGRKSGLKHKENKTGICGISSEEHSKRMTKTNSQKWMCTETGYLTNSGALTTYQKKRGIDTSKRIRIM